MDRKGIKLVEKALKGHRDVIENWRISRRWNKVADYVNDWDEVFNHIGSHYGAEEARRIFSQACEKYNASVKNPQLSTKQKAGLLVGAGLVGLAFGLRSK